MVLLYLEQHPAPPPSDTIPSPKWRSSRWIMSRLAVALEQTERGLTDFRLDDASSALYRFFWDELCSWYLEITKPVLQGEKSELGTEVAATLVHVLETSLRALHPFVPFLTEELWQRLPRPASRPVSIALAPYPTTADGRPDDDAERDMALLMSAIGAARFDRTGTLPVCNRRPPR